MAIEFTIRYMRTLLFFFIIAAAGCMSSTGTSIHFVEIELYVERLTIEGICEDGTFIGDPSSGVWMNCIRTVEFHSSGEVNLMVSDIMNRGTYRREPQSITTEFSTPGDVPDTVVFTIQKDGTLLDDFIGSIWRKE